MKETKIQRLVIQDAENPLESRTVEIEIPRKDRILCTEPYVLEDLNRYNLGPACDAQVIRQVESGDTQTLDATVIPDGEGRHIVSAGGKYSYTLSDGMVSGLSSRFDMSQPFSVRISKPKKGILGLPEIDLTDTIRNAVVETMVRTAEEYKAFSSGKRGIPSSAYVSKVVQAVGSAGYLVQIDQVKCFMPKSQICTHIYPNNDIAVGAEVPVIPVNFDTKRNSVVVSNKAYGEVMARSTMDSWDKDAARTGTVLYKKFRGVMLAFGEYFTAWLPQEDMDEATYAMFCDAGNTMKGVELSVNKDFTNKDGLAVVTQTFRSRKLWQSISNKYFNGMTLKGKVTSAVNRHGFFTCDFGHGDFSAISDKAELSVGQNVILTVQYFNPKERKMKLKVF